MKSQFKGFLSGFLFAALVFTLALSALAITGRMTIDVDPINIQVNGETFVPKDVNGKEVPVFAYEGTTYAPLRALAEAYGLEVGYDADANMATVNDPEAKPEQPVTPDTTANATDYSDWSAEDEAAYQEFKGMWEVSERVWDTTGRPETLPDEDLNGYTFTFDYKGKAADSFVINPQYALRYARELSSAVYNEYSHVCCEFCAGDQAAFCIYTKQNGNILY